MIDFHSHFLPKMDDGSKSTEESVQMLSELVRQGIDTVIATPHFYANDESLETFLQRRSTSATRLEGVIPDGIRILLGSEVRYYSGISHMNDLRLLTIGDSEFLLLEMPFSKWTEYMLREVEELAATTNLKIVIAHIDRYIKLQKNGTFERLLNSGIYIQANAEYFNGLFTKNRAIKELSCGMIHFIGSDSHNMTTRAPNIGKTYEFIEKKLGVGFINRMDEYGKNVLMQI